MPNAEKIVDVKQLVQELHASKVINLDTKLGDLLTSAQSIGAIDPSGEIASALILWDNYAVVIKGMVAAKGMATDLKNLDAILNRVK